LPPSVSACPTASAFFIVAVVVVVVVVAAAVLFSSSSTTTKHTCSTSPVRSTGLGAAPPAGDGTSQLHGVHASVAAGPGSSETRSSCIMSSQQLSSCASRTQRLRAFFPRPALGGTGGSGLTLVRTMTDALHMNWYSLRKVRARPLLSVVS